MRSFRVEPEAELDLAEASDWYDEQELGAGIDFVLAMRRLFQVIAERPKSFREEEPGVRFAIRRPYPYKAYFLVTEESVRVFAVLHGARRPYTWESRVDRSDE